MAEFFPWENERWIVVDERAMPWFRSEALYWLGGLMGEW